MTLDQLEALIATQRPADVPWTPVTDYSAAARDVVEAPHADLIVQTFRPNYVFDIGCGPGHLVRLLEQRGVSVAGFDKHPVGDAYPLDIARDGLMEGDTADLVICREVLEHLTVREIACAVRGLCALSCRYVYVTTRFNDAPATLFDVRTSDDLDPTHISLLPMDLLRLLFVLEGFRRCPDLERAMDWKGYGRVLVYARG